MCMLLCYTSAEDFKSKFSKYIFLHKELIFNALYHHKPLCCVECIQKIKDIDVSLAYFPFPNKENK